MTNSENPFIEGYSVKKVDPSEIARINERLSAGDSIWDNYIRTALMGALKPVLISTEILYRSDPLTATPLARSALEQASRIGNIFLVSQNADINWTQAEAHLKDLGIWRDDTFLVTGRNLHPAPQDAIEKYIELRKKHRVSLLVSDFQEEDAAEIMPINLLAPVFMKPYDLPFITDEALTKNAGIYDVVSSGLQIESGLVDVRDFYLYPFLDTPLPFKIHEETRFRPFRKDDAAFAIHNAAIIQELKYSPHSIIRSQRALPPSQDLPGQYYDHGTGIYRYIEGVSELRRLEEAGVPVAGFGIVVGPASEQGKAHYHVKVEKIGNGINFILMEIPPEKQEEIGRKTDECFSGIANYYIDRTKSSGWYLDDLACGRPVAIFTPGGGLDQYVYGSRFPGEEERLYLVDLDPKLNFFDSDTNHTTRMETSQRDFYSGSLKLFAQMIKNAEFQLGSVKLDQSREVLLSFLRSQDPSHTFYEAMIVIREMLGDPTIDEAKAAYATELARKKAEITEILSPVIDQLDIKESDYIKTIEDFYEDRKRSLSHSLSTTGTAKEPSIAIYNDASDYNWHELNTLSGFFYVFLRDQVQELLGKDVLETAVLKYGSIVWGVFNELIHPRREELLAKQDRRHFWKAKASATLAMVAELGWEEDIMPHLDLVSRVIPDDVAVANKYVPLALRQQGIEYQFPYTLETLRSMFRNSNLDPNSEDDFTNFVVTLVDDFVDESLVEDLEKVKEKHGEDNADALEELIIAYEVERILDEAEKGFGLNNERS